MYKKFLIACLLLISLFGCKKENQTNVIVNIADDFYIDMFEDISNGEQRLQLDISTIALQSCLNYQIDYDIDIDKESHAIDLIINDLVEPTDCIDGSSPAKLSIPLGYLPNGYYSFNVNLKDAVFNKGRLAVFDDQYLLNMNSDYGIEVVNTVLYRIPQNTLWGYVAFENSATTADGEDFISSLENLSGINSITNNSLYSSGYYGYFSLDEDRNVALSEDTNTNYHNSFIFRNDNADISAVRTLVEDACEANNDLSIHIFTEYGLDIMCE